MMNITIFKDEDIKKSGGFKKRNNVKSMNKEQFKQYVKDNNLTLSKGYIDSNGFISNGEKFRCSYKGFIVGVTNLIKEVIEK